MTKAYWRIADTFTFPLAFLAALGAIESSFAYGTLGAWMADQSIADFAACVAD